jgi:hypothetical protein
MKANILTGFLCLLVTASIGSAQTTRDSDLSVDEATNQFIAKDFSNALTLFRRLRAESKEPAARIRLQWNIARCLEELGRHAESLRIFEDYSRSVEDPVRSSRARSKIHKLSQLVFGAISVSCEGGGAIQVSIKGSKHTTPCPAVLDRLTPGATVIEGRRQGGDTVRSIVKVRAGQNHDVILKFRTEGPPAKMVQATSSAVWPWYVGATVVLVAGAATVWAVNRDDPSPRHQVHLCIEAECNE